MPPLNLNNPAWKNTSLGISNMSTTTPQAKPGVQAPTYNVPTSTGTMAPLGSFSLSSTKPVPVSAVTTSAPARVATDQNYTAAVDLANRNAYAQNELERKRALEAEAAAKVAADAEAKAKATTTPTTGRGDGLNATDRNGNRVYVDPSQINTAGVIFDDPQYNTPSLDEQKKNIYDDAMAQIDADLKRQQDALDYIASGADPAEIAMLNGIKDSYAQRRNAMAQLNKARVDSMGTMGIRSGRARYASEIQDSIIGQEEAAGLSRIQELYTQEQQEISAAQTAYRTGKYKELRDTISSLEKAREEKTKLIQQQFENARNLENDAIAKAKEARDEYKFQMDTKLKIKEDALNTLEAMASSGVMPDDAAFEDAASATGYSKSALISMWTQYQNEKAMSTEKDKLALSLQRANIASANALTQSRLAGIITDNVVNAATAAGLSQADLKALSGLNIDEGGMIAFINRYASSGKDWRTFWKESGLPDEMLSEQPSFSSTLTGIKKAGSSSSSASGSNNWWEI